MDRAVDAGPRPLGGLPPDRGIRLRGATGPIMIKWHRLRRVAGDVDFTARRLREGLAAGASMEVDLRRHADGGFACLHDGVLESETDGSGQVAAASVEDLRRLHMRRADGTISGEPLMLLDDLVAIAGGECHSDTLVQFDLKEQLADLDEAAITSFTALVAPAAGRYVLSGDDWSAVRAIGRRIDGLKLGFDPSELPEARGLKSAADFSRFTRFVLDTAPAATFIYLEYRLVLASLESGFDMIGGLHAGGKVIDAWTFDVASRQSFADLARLMASGVDQISTNDSIALQNAAEAIGRVIHLVFKTHLDIGFTDHAERVRRQYHERFIPQAVETGEHFHGEDPDHPKFIWTTGAWLIADHLERADRAAAARLERAIERGLIRWHALPFTTHSELMSPTLFRAGLSYAQELDRRFGVSTIAAKMTDVPGHTIGIVPLLAEAGVRFLHLGVNAASPVPDVPAVFRWRAPGGAEIVVMYQDSYGATCFPDGLDDGLSFAHTIDNVGPQSISQTIDAHRHLQAEHPDARIHASTLDAYGALLWAARDKFPVIETEIGDSWIHGIGSDPTKTARFLALQRLYDRFAEEELTPARRAFGRGLAMVAEHTWGVDIKTFLRDEVAWDRPAFEAARASDPRFAYTEASWAEQRRYLDSAIAELDGIDHDLAVRASGPLDPEPGAGEMVSVDGPLEIGDWAISIDRETGDIARILAPDGTTIEGLGGSLLAYRYESYDASDVAAHLDSYLTQRIDWALLDHGKPGLERARTARSAVWVPKLAELRREAGTLTVRAELPTVASEELGAPASVTLILRVADQASLEVAVVLHDKPANRMPEASFFAVTPRGGSAWEFRKMGLWQAAGRVAPRGGGQLQAVTAARARLGDGPAIEIVPLDTPLVAPADTKFMVFAPAPPAFPKGIRFNLHNNKWGTNFPMWWSGDFTARFALRLGPNPAG